MASNGDKWLEDWKVASKKYCDLLEEMVKELHQYIETIPNTDDLDEIAGKIKPIHNAGVSFRDDIERARKSAPSPPQPPNEYADH